MLGTYLTVGILLLSSGSEGATRLSPFEKRYEKTVYPSTVLKFEPGEREYAAQRRHLSPAHLANNRFVDRKILNVFRFEICYLEYLPRAARVSSINETCIIFFPI